MKRTKKITSILLILAMLFALAGCKGPEGEGGADEGEEKAGTPSKKPGFTLATAAAPQRLLFPHPEDFKDKEGGFDDDAFEKASDAYYKEQSTLGGLAESCGESFRKFTENSFTLMKGLGGENVAESPVSIYMALAMLSECAGGATRSEILDALGAKSIEEARKTAKALWEICYNADGIFTEELGASLWLNENINFDKETIDNLALYYYADSFSGNPEDKDFFKAFTDWLNDKTGGLLKDKIGELEPFDTEDAAVIASSVYFKASWLDKFVKEANKNSYFHAAAGDVRCEFMQYERTRVYCKKEGFGAVSLPFEGGSYMWIVLPDKGSSPEKLLSSGALSDFAFDISENGMPTGSEVVKVELSLPKFDISSSMTLNDKLKEIGINSAFMPGIADFGPLTKDSELAVSKVLHDARVKIDEDGCEAAAYTAITLDTAAMPPETTVVFNVDRPFAFIVATGAGLPLFTGVVNTPV